MSRASTVCTGTRVQVKGNSSKKTSTSVRPTTSTTSGVVNRTDGVNSTSQSKSSPSSSRTKSTAAKTVTTNTPPKPRIVTLANLNKSAGGGRGKKTNVNRTSSKQTPQQNFRNSSTTTLPVLARTGKDFKMWDDQEKHTLNASGHSSMSFRGDRNMGGYGGYATQGQGNELSATLGSSPACPAARSRLQTDRTTAGTGQDQAADEERRDTYQPNGGYTLHTPNPKKREKIQNQASQELERLAAYKEKQKVGRVSMKPSRIGGSKMSEEETRRQQQREQENNKYENIRKRQQWDKEKKEREDKEYEEKKARAREQAEKNKQREEQRQRDMRQDRQRWIQNGGLQSLESGESQRSTHHHHRGEQGHDADIDEGALNWLTQMFPFKSPKKLGEMLQAAGGDVNTVVDWLSN